MADPKGFLKYERRDAPKQDVHERIQHFDDFEQNLSEEELRRQAARCMGCGVPHCHTYGCPVENRIPDWNDLVHRGHWRRALDVLHATNNFPEFTGKTCPAPCEVACTLAIHEAPVSIKHIEWQIVERGWQEGWIVPEPPEHETGLRVAIVGSGPAGLAAAQELRRNGHAVTVFERSDRVGGLLRYGIPDFKMAKDILDRRLNQLEAEGITFEANVDVGQDLSARFLRRSFDAILLATGALAPRDVGIPGRDLAGVHFAMTYLTQQNRRLLGVEVPPPARIDAQGKHVVVIGGGDTGSDCVGTAIRQGATSVTQLDYHEPPPTERLPENPWPEWPLVLQTSSSHEEGCERKFGLLTKEFVGTDGRVSGIRLQGVSWLTPEEKATGAYGDARWKEIPDQSEEIPADLVLISAGFKGPEGGLLEAFELGTDPRGRVLIDDRGMTTQEGVFAAGDCVLGASLVVEAIAEGRRRADDVERYLAEKLLEKGA